MFVPAANTFKPEAKVLLDAQVVALHDKGVLRMFTLLFVI
jgi:hypothetical protein